MISKKRGIVQETFAYVLLTLVGLIILIWLFGVFFPSVANASVRNYICKYSLSLQSYQKGPNIPVVGPITEKLASTATLEKIQKDCPMRKQSIKKGESTEKVKKIIADEMATCWWRVGEGETDFYSDLSTSFWKTNTLCLPCAEIRPKEGTYSIPVNEMAGFLATHPSLYDKKKTYAQYITGSGEEYGKLLQGRGDLKLSDKEALFVFFVAAKKDKITGDLYQAGVGSGIAAAILLKLGILTAVVTSAPVAITAGAIVVVAGVTSAVLQQNDLHATVLLLTAREAQNICDVL